MLRVALSPKDIYVLLSKRTIYHIYVYITKATDKVKPMKESTFH